MAFFSPGQGVRQGQFGLPAARAWRTLVLAAAAASSACTTVTYIPDDVPLSEGPDGGGSPDPDPVEPVDPDPVEPEPVPIDAGPTPEPTVSPGFNLFGDDRIIEVRITLDPAALLALEQNGDDEVYHPAQAVVSGAAIGEVQLESIGVRHKGAYSLHHCFEGGVRSYAGECARLSYKLKFDEYADLRLDGLKRLNLHASSADDTRLRELVAYDLFRSFGVDGPRTAIANVFVNGELEGVFIAVEEIDGRYTKAHFPGGGGDGNLYKEVWPAIGVTETAVLDALRTNEDAPDVSGFMQFSAAVAAAPFSGFATDMAPWIDVEHTLRYIAVDRALRNWDGIMAFYGPKSPHNFYWYHDSGSDGRFKLIPWDMDNALWSYDPYMQPHSFGVAPIPNWNVEPSNCQSRPVWQLNGDTRVVPPRCDRLLDRLAETQFPEFETIAAELLGGPFDAEALSARVDHYGGLLEPLLMEDPSIDYATWRGKRSNFKYLLEAASEEYANWVAQGLRHE